MAAAMRRRKTAEWAERLAAANVPHAVVRDHAAVFADEQVAARGMRLTVRDPAGNPVDLVGNPFHLTGAPAGAARMPPKLGAQTDEVLRELGLTDGELAALRAKGAV